MAHGKYLTIRPVNSGTNSPLKLPSDEIVIAATIRPTGHDSFLNKNNGFSRFIVLPTLFEIYS